MPRETHLTSSIRIQDENGTSLHKLVEAPWAWGLTYFYQQPSLAVLFASAFQASLSERRDQQPQPGVIQSRRQAMLDAPEGTLTPVPD